MPSPMIIPALLEQVRNARFGSLLQWKMLFSFGPFRDFIPNVSHVFKSIFCFFQLRAIHLLLKTVIIV